MKTLIILVFAGLMAMAPLDIEASSSSEDPVFSDEFPFTITLYELRPVIMLDDGTHWIFLWDHWFHLKLDKHAEWCGCSTKNN